ncbi:MAG: hypothetical protein R2741_00290 [Methanolobus sp.]
MDVLIILSTDLYGMDIELNQEGQSISFDLIDEINKSITEHNNEQISRYIMDYRGDEINQTIALMCDTTDSNMRYELANKQLDTIYRTANPGGADIVLMIW